MAERLKAPVLKTGILFQGIVGSNPTPSAKNKYKLRAFQGSGPALQRDSYPYPNPSLSGAPYGTLMHPSDTVRRASSSLGMISPVSAFTTHSP